MENETNFTSLKQDCLKQAGKCNPIAADCGYGHWSFRPD
jgi:hypothetical protein